MTPQTRVVGNSERASETRRQFVPQVAHTSQHCSLSWPAAARFQRISDMLRDVSLPALGRLLTLEAVPPYVSCCPLLVVHDFNVADQIADDFYTIEICSHDFHGGEVIFR